MSDPTRIHIHCEDASYDLADACMEAADTWGRNTPAKSRIPQNTLIGDWPTVRQQLHDAGYECRRTGTWEVELAWAGSSEHNQDLIRIVDQILARTYNANSLDQAIQEVSANTSQNQRRVAQAVRLGISNPYSTKDDRAILFQNIPLEAWAYSGQRTPESD